MKNLVLLIALLILAIKARAVETIICSGSEETYSCALYSGQEYDVYNYGPEYLSQVITLSEIDSFDLANPYYSDDQEVIHTVAYSPFVEPHQVPQAFTDSDWQFGNEFGSLDEPIPWAPGEKSHPDVCQ